MIQERPQEDTLEKVRSLISDLFSLVGRSMKHPAGVWRRPQIHKFEVQ